MARIETIIVGLVILQVLDLVLDHFSKGEEPPKCAKVLERCEMVFGGIVLISSGFFGAIVKSGAGALAVLIVGILWFVLAFGLYHGKKWARILCIILSIIRIPTIIGIPFSIVSLYIVMFSENYKNYMAERNSAQ